MTSSEQEPPALPEVVEELGLIGRGRLGGRA
jgi:hypothetical protein